MTLAQKLWQVNWSMLLLIVAVAAIGFAMLYSAANGSMDPWASRPMVRFVGGLGLMFLVALVDMRAWLRYAYPIYGVPLLLLTAGEHTCRASCRERVGNDV